jgi:hypothetical protein
MINSDPDATEVIEYNHVMKYFKDPLGSMNCFFCRRQTLLYDSC